MGQNTKALKRLVELNKEERFEALNFFNSHWFSPARKLKAKPDASLMMRGMAFLEGLLQHFKNGQLVHFTGGELDGLLLSVKAEPFALHSFPSADAVREISQGAATTIICLAATSEVAKVLVSSLHGYVKGNIYAFGYPRGMSAVFDERPSLEDARTYVVRALANASDAGLNLLQEVGFVPLLNEGALHLIENFTTDPLSFGYATIMEKQLS